MGNSVSVKERDGLLLQPEDTALASRAVLTDVGVRFFQQLDLDHMNDMMNGRYPPQGLKDRWHHRTTN